MAGSEDLGFHGVGRVQISVKISRMKWWTYLERREGYNVMYVSMWKDDGKPKVHECVFIGGMCTTCGGDDGNNGK